MARFGYSTESASSLLITYHPNLVPTVTEMSRVFFAYNAYDGKLYAKKVQNGASSVFQIGGPFTMPDLSNTYAAKIHYHPEINLGSLGAEALGTAQTLINLHNAAYDHSLINTVYSWGDHAGLYTPLSFKQHFDTLTGLVKAINGVYTAIPDKSGEWQQAYTWGNHASAGYITDAPIDTEAYVREDGQWVSLEDVITLNFKVQSDWDQVDPSKIDFIKNKPDLTVYVPYTGATSDVNLGLHTIATTGVK